MTENCKNHFKKSVFSLIEGGLSDSQPEVQIRKEHIPPYQLYQQSLEILAKDFLRSTQQATGTES